MIYRYLKILTTLLATIGVISFAWGQPQKENSRLANSDADRVMRIKLLTDSLCGTWQLVRTVRHENGDSLSQEPSLQLWSTPGAKPFTTIIIDSLGNFEIEQACQKCPYLFWKGKCEIDISRYQGRALFYINFVDRRQMAVKGKRRKKALALAFNGYLTCFANTKLVLLDKEGTEWIYLRNTD